MSKLRKIAVLGAAAEAARRYARNNPEKADRYVAQASEFADRRTKGKYSRQIDSLARKARDAARGDGPRH